MGGLSSGKKNLLMLIGQQLVQAKEEVNKPFEKENELRSVQERLTKINTELDMKPKEEPKKMIKKEELKKCL